MGVGTPPPPKATLIRKGEGRGGEGDWCGCGWRSWLSAAPSHMAFLTLTLNPKP